MARRHARGPRGLGALLIGLALLLLPGCRVEHLLLADLPRVSGRLTVGGTVSQVFLSPSDGLNRVSLGVVPPSPTKERAVAGLTDGATLEIQYAPEADPGYPDGRFHEWPAEHAWLGELTGRREIGQTFVSRYPNLNGITLRVATFGADLSPGEGRLVDGPPVPVRRLPVDGERITELPGGSTVRVEGSAEGWARVLLPDGQTGYVELSRFQRLPPPGRVNDRDVVLRLYREGEAEPIRTATINARAMHDNSHVTFTFEPLPDSMGARYRFVLTSPAAVPGNAVTFRYAEADVYPDGTRLDGGAPVPGDLIFRPAYAADPPLARIELDRGVISGQTSTLEVAFAPIPDTADRALRLVVRAGQAPLVVTWSEQLPPGGYGLVLSDRQEPPEGALVFNVGYRAEVALGQVARGVLGKIGRDARVDTRFFALYGVALVGVSGWCGLAVWRRGRDGR
ncbi:MAG: SH3 domain-containing protein [Sphaerobacter sp.]|nr:SH3 domain-containing protein [Sphaerobacter sp.]